MEEKLECGFCNLDTVADPLCGKLFKLSQKAIAHKRCMVSYALSKFYHICIRLYLHNIDSLD